MNTLYHMWVYNRNDLVARVDYDYCRNYVSVENYTDNIFIRPFGIKEDVTISDLEAGETYCFRVKPYNKTADGKVTWSKSFSVTATVY